MVLKEYSFLTRSSVMLGSFFLFIATKLLFFLETCLHSVKSNGQND